MRCALSRFPVACPYFNYICSNIFSVWFHNLNGIADTEFIFLFDAGKSPIVQCLHAAQIYGFADICVGIVDLTLLIRLSEIEPCGKLPVGTLPDLPAYSTHEPLQ